MQNKLFITLVFFLQTLYLGFTIDHSLLDSYRPKPTALIKTYEKVLKMSLKSLYSEDEREHNMTAQSILISRNCFIAFNHFADVVVNFTSCAVKSAKPIRLCENCKNQYNETVAAYNNLKISTECEEFYFGSDQVVIVDIIYKEATGLWSKNYCANCNQSSDQTLFFEVSKKLLDCTNKTESINSSAICSECQSLYANLSGIYHGFVQSSLHDKVCMDIVDSMNLTRKMWKEYNCTVLFDTNIGYLNKIVIITIFISPGLFYLLARNVSIIDDVKIVRPKRKFTTIVVPDLTISE